MGKFPFVFFDQVHTATLCADPDNSGAVFKHVIHDVIAQTQGINLIMHELTYLIRFFVDLDESIRKGTDPYSPGFASDSIGTDFEIYLWRQVDGAIDRLSLFQVELNQILATAF